MVVSVWAIIMVILTGNIITLPYDLTLFQIHHQGSHWFPRHVARKYLPNLLLMECRGQYYWSFSVIIYLLYFTWLIYQINPYLWCNDVCPKRMSLKLKYSFLLAGVTVVPCEYPTGPCASGYFQIFSLLFAININYHAKHSPSMSDYLFRFLITAVLTTITVNMIWIVTK